MDAAQQRPTVFLDPKARSLLPDGFRSPYYHWFVEMGYPNLDVLQEGRSWWKDGKETGEWHIIEFYRSPVIPSLTPWNYVLQGIRYQEITRSFIEKHVKNLDLTRKASWEIAEAKTLEMEMEQDAVQKHREETAQRALEIIKRSPLYERMHANGLKELDPARMWAHVPHHQKIGSNINKAFAL